MVFPHHLHDDFFPSCKMYIISWVPKQIWNIATINTQHCWPSCKIVSRGFISSHPATHLCENVSVWILRCFVRSPPKSNQLIRHMHRQPGSPSLPCLYIGKPSTCTTAPACLPLLPPPGPFHGPAGWQSGLPAGGSPAAGRPEGHARRNTPACWRRSHPAETRTVHMKSDPKSS